MSGEIDRVGRITPEQARGFAELAVRGIRTEYPNKLDHVINGPEDLRSPRDLHPAFYGCLDWHSAVHSHWLLVRLLKTVPRLGYMEDEMRAALRENLTRENLAAERAYLDGPNRRSFERTYGWAWLLKLAAELHGWDDPDGREWAEGIAPLADAFVERYLDFLPKQTYPIRSGTHTNTAFGLTLALDYAELVGHVELHVLLRVRSYHYFGRDRADGAPLEPGGNDFLSPSLMEAALMARLLPRYSFLEWFDRFALGLTFGRPENLLTPAIVSDRTDPQIVHLDGLNLSRAWCMLMIEKALPVSDKRRKVLLEAAARHADASLPHVASGDYMGEHWLASFALLMLSVGSRWDR